MSLLFPQNFLFTVTTVKALSLLDCFLSSRVTVLKKNSNVTADKIKEVNSRMQKSLLSH